MDNNQNQNKNLEKLLKILETSSQGVEGTVKTEKIVGTVEEDGVLFQEIKQTVLAPDGSIQEKIVHKIKYFSCGCLSKGRENAGTKCDVCKKTSCDKHSYRCRRCGRPICIKCAKEKHGITFCTRCWLILTAFVFLQRKYIT